MDAEYTSWTATANALKSVARTTAKSTGRDYEASLRMAYFDRLLSRVFHESHRDRWVLKGGSGMLARVPNTRATKDIDLATSAVTIDEAEEALIEAASYDLGDHVRLEHVSSKPIVEADMQPDITGRRVMFALVDAQKGKPIHRIPVDLVVEDGIVGHTDLINPASRLTLPKNLPTAPYRLYPLPDQVADKTAATVVPYHGHESTRVKDLVDLVVIARTQKVSITPLRAALSDRFESRGATVPPAFIAPKSWANRYSQIASRVPACRGLEDIDAAEKLVRAFVSPALTASSSPALSEWDPRRGWNANPDDASAPSPEDPSSIPPSSQSPGGPGPSRS